MSTYALLVLSMTLASKVIAQDMCKPVSDETRQSIFSYLGARYVLDGSDSFVILSDSPQIGSCYREVLVNHPRWASPLLLFVSPDHRFISASLVDLNGGDKTWRDATESRVQRLLSGEARQRPTRMLEVTVFSDYECPYCARLATYLDAIPSHIASQTMLSYRHFPLSTHSWSKRAAGAAICVAEQNAVSNSMHSVSFD